MRNKSKREAEEFRQLVSRREFMKYCMAASSSVLFMDPMRMLLASIVDGLVASAQAQTMQVNPKKYLSLILSGGPPRWVYDLPLCPNPGDPMPGNSKMIATSLVAGSRAYETVRMGSVNMPKLWNTGLCFEGGMTSNMRPLSENTLMIRGIRGINSHDIGRQVQTRPDTALASLNGAIADHSHLNIPAVNLGGSPFKSYSGIGEMPVSDLSIRGTETPIDRILAPFKENRSPAFFANKARLSPYLDSAMQALRTHHESQTPGIESLYRGAGKAEVQIQQSLQAFGDNYAFLAQKYTKIILDVYQASDWQTKLGFNMDGVSFNFTRLADIFAVSEYLFNSNLSSTVYAGLGNISGLASGATGIGALVNSSGAPLPASENDAHNLSADQHLRSFSFYYRAVASCIYEFSRSMNDWDNTVVHLASEFTRTPRDVDHGQSEGSDHGWDGTNSSIYSGSITNGPYLVGNIINSSSRIYSGLWGKGAPVQIDNASKELGVGNMASAVAAVVGIPRLQTNFASPIYVKNGKVQSFIGAPKTVV